MNKKILWLHNFYIFLSDIKFGIIFNKTWASNPMNILIDFRRKITLEGIDPTSLYFIAITDNSEKLIKYDFIEPFKIKEEFYIIIPIILTALSVPFEHIDSHEYQMQKKYCVKFENIETYPTGVLIKTDKLTPSNPFTLSCLFMPDMFKIGKTDILSVHCNCSSSSNLYDFIIQKLQEPTQLNSMDAQYLLRLLKEFPSVFSLHWTCGKFEYTGYINVFGEQSLSITLDFKDGKQYTINLSPFLGREEFLGNLVFNLMQCTDYKSYFSIYARMRALGLITKFQ